MADQQDGMRTSAPFRAMARIVGEIGDELISSDDIALYELIKNAYDAQAQVVRVSVVTPSGLASLDAIVDQSTSAPALKRFLSENLDDLDVINSLLAADRRTSEGRATLRSEIAREFRLRSSIEVDDNGEGMTTKRLEDGFLILASTERMLGPRGSRPTLGSKGVGRFSAKRLGRWLEVETYSEGAPSVEHLMIDWSKYAAQSTQLLEQVTNELWSTPAKPGQKAGTKLRITDLHREWSTTMLEEMARERLASLMNPYFPRSGFRVVVRFNQHPIDVHDLQAEILDLFRLRVEGSVDPASMSMKLQFTRHLGERSSLESAEVSISGNALLKAGDPSAVGPFSFVFYDFLRNDPRLGSLTRRKELDGFLRAWGGGGPMLFRDGFRVMPYGQPGYDWLEIDRTRYQVSGTRLRTLAMTGYVTISSDVNPGLVDQTNREGLRDTVAFRHFRGLLRYAVTETNNQLKTWWPPDRSRTLRTQAKKITEARAALDEFADEAVELSARIAAAPPQASIADLAGALRERVAGLRGAASTYAVVAGTRTSQIPAESYPTLIELAGLGMVAEQLTHELLAAIDRAEAVLARLRLSASPSESILIEQLVANFNSLRRTASLLAPLTQASRRRKANLDVLDEAQAVASHYQAIAEGSVAFHGRSDGRPLIVRMNRGVLLQVFDNLINNSLYWMTIAKTIRPAITVTTVADGVVNYADNGPGIGARLAGSIFQPFVSTKPDGRGLGLFIARELLDLQECSITTGEPDPDGQIRGFRMNLARAVR